MYVYTYIHTYTYIYTCVCVCIANANGKKEYPTHVYKHARSPCYKSLMLLPCVHGNFHNINIAQISKSYEYKHCVCRHIHVIRFLHDTDAYTQVFTSTRALLT